MFEAAPDSFMVTSPALNQAVVTPVAVTDQDRRRKVAIKCLELEGMLESQGYSPKEIETKVASFRALLMRPTISNPENNNSNGIRKEVSVIKDNSPERKRDSSSCSDRRSRRKKKRKKDHKRRKKDRKHRRRSSESDSDGHEDPTAKR